MSDVFKRTGIIASIIIFILGFLAFAYCWKTLNVKNLILGSFYHEPEVVKISDFEYEIKSLLFTNSGTNENEYFASATAKPVSNFDRTKKYTVTINDIQANRVYGDYSYINANFTNTFISTQDKELLTDTLNIKINFYTEGTKIVFTTQNGEQAISLWTSYIAKNGFVIKIVEDNYNQQIKVDNLKSYKTDLFFDEKLIKTINHNAIDDFYLPEDYMGFPIYSWRDDEGNYFTNNNRKELPLKEIKLYAVTKKTGLQFHFNNNTITKINEISDNSCKATLYLDSYSIEDLETDNIYLDIINLSKNYKAFVEVYDYYGIVADATTNRSVYYNRTDNDCVNLIWVSSQFTVGSDELEYTCSFRFCLNISNNRVTPYLELWIYGNVVDNECLNSFTADMLNNNINFKINLSIGKSS